MKRTLFASLVAIGVSLALFFLFGLASTYLSLYLVALLPNTHVLTVAMVARILAVLLSGGMVGMMLGLVASRPVSTGLISAALVPVWLAIAAPLVLPDLVWDLVGLVIITCLCAQIVRKSRRRASPPGTA